MKKYKKPTKKLSLKDQKKVAGGRPMTDRYPS